MEEFPLAERIYAAVRCIPHGKVASYSQIAARAGNRNLRRYVGNVLHKNPDPAVTPCHRVVNARGFCSGSFAFGRSGVQRQKLEAEGVSFTATGHVDLAATASAGTTLSKCGWNWKMHLPEIRPENGSSPDNEQGNLREQCRCGRRFCSEDACRVLHILQVIDLHKAFSPPHPHSCLICTPPHPH